MKRIFLDTGIFELFFSGNQNIKQIFNQIKNETISAFTLELNLCENFYKICEKLGKETAQIRNISLRNSKIKILDINEQLTIRSGYFKCKYSQILSIVDAYIIGCADLNNLLIYSTDSNFKDIKEVKNKIFSLE
ncbi:MAG: PIN domain-containing protein [Promethearchaeota archaeon]